MTKSTTIIGAAVVGIVFVTLAYIIQNAEQSKPIYVEGLQVPPTVLPKRNTPADNAVTRAQKFLETAHPARIQNNNEKESFQSYLNPYDYPSPSISQAYEFRLDRKSLLT
jgi:hypothetical protein